MRASAALFFAFLAAAVSFTGHADGEGPSDTPERAAAREVARAFRAGDTAAVAGAAARDDPDPWAVVEDLLARGEAGAAEAFAIAAPRPDTERLPAYVALARSFAEDVKARAAIDRALPALRGGDPTGALATIDEGPGALQPYAAARRSWIRGLALEAIGRTAEAITPLAQTADAARELGALRTLQRALEDSARVATARSEWKRVLEPAREGRELADRRGAPEGRAGCEATLGLARAKLGEVAEGAAHLARAAALAREIADPAARAAAAFQVGRAERSLGRRVAAAERLEEALSAARASGRAADVTTILLTLGSVRQEQGRPVKAREVHEEALRTAEALGDEYLRSQALVNLSNTLRDLADYDRAVEIAGKAVDAGERTRVPFIVAYGLQARANARYGLGDFLGAAEDARRALEIARSLRDDGTLLNLLGNLGVVQQAMGNSAEALRAFDDARAIADRLGDRERSAWLLVNRAHVSQDRGECAQALRETERALAVFEELGLDTRTAWALTDLANLCVALGETARARVLLDRAMALDEGLENADGALSACLAGASLRTVEEDWEGALPLLRRAVALARASGAAPMLTVALHELAVAQRMLGDLDGASASADESLDRMRRLGLRREAVWALAESSEVALARGDGEGAIRLAREAVDEAERAAVPEASFIALRDLANARLETGDPKGALEPARRAVSLVNLLARGLSDSESVGKRSRLADAVEVGARAAAALDDAEGLAFFLESGRAGALLEAIGGRGSLAEALVPPDLRREEAAARAAEAVDLKRYEAALGRGNRPEVAARRADLDRARAAVLATVARIQREARASAAVVYPEPAPLYRLQAALREGDVLVEWALLRKEAVALVVGPKQVVVRRLGAPGPIRTAIEDLRACCADGAPWEAPASALRRLLVGPLALPPGTRRVLAAPDGDLAYVPLSILFPDLDAAYVPSGTTYEWLRQADGGGGSRVLALGDPAYGDGPRFHPRLPSSGEEARRVGDQVLLGGDATEPNLRAALGAPGRWRAVHLACHGFVDAKRPLLSSLALAPVAGSDGCLRALDVFRMHIAADLVVLSACDTGRGTVVRGEGLMGLARGFMAAGAPRVLCSLWAVDDAATAALMTAFYARWNPKDGSKALPAAAALRDAQERVRSEVRWSHPRYWAAWVLWGLVE